MRRSNLPKMLFCLSSFFISGSFLITGCRPANSKTISYESSRRSAANFSVNINSADATELEALPHVGPSLAKKIIEHRQRYGSFRRPEHLLIVEGMSENRFLELRQFINTE